MTQLLLIRHGQSSANHDAIFAGHINVPLSDLGRKQAELTAEYIYKNYQVDRVYASDLQRAFDTGKAVAEKFGLSVIPNPQLREIYAGEWEGVTFEELQQTRAETYGRWRFDIGNSVCDGGESVAHLQARILEALRTIARENESKTVVVATHATPVRSVQCHCEKKSLSEMKDVPWVSNASVTVITCDHGEMNLTAVGLDAHIGDLGSRLQANV